MPSPAKHIEVVHVYGLIASGGDGQVRYVGITSMTLARRLQMHLSTARRGCHTYRGRWIRKVLAAGAQVEIVLLHDAGLGDWQLWEQHFIAVLPNLTNATCGGEGILDPTPETRERMRLAQLGKKQSPETVALRAKALKGNQWNVGKTLSAETRAKIAAGLTGVDRANMNWTAAGLERVKEASRGNTRRRGVPHTDATKARMKASRANQIRHPHTPETIAKMRAAKLGKKVSPETRDRMSAAAKAKPPISEATREKLRDAVARSWVARRAARGDS